MKYNTEVKRLAIVAMFSDDTLLKRLVLKGGNAIDLVYQATPRASLDLDFSMPDEFGADELPRVRQLIENVLSETFHGAGYEAFDVRLTEKPEVPHPNKPMFWGGYEVEFKVISLAEARGRTKNLEDMRRRATVIGPHQRKTFRMDISKFEDCAGKSDRVFDDYTIFVYTPEMLVFEKLRAICQQMPEYAAVVPSPSRSARARDFFDIYILAERYQIDFTSEANSNLARGIFTAKQVPLHLIGRIQETRDFHEPDFPSVRETIDPGYPLQEFTFYFDYVVEKCRLLEALWVE
jgi:predicted nucleotidyltransferase component of viral defense system